MTTEEEKVNIKGEIDKTEVAKKLKIFQIALLVGFGATLPITVPMFGGNAEDVADLVKLSIPVIGVMTPVGLYRIHELVSRKKKLQEELDSLENNNQEPEEKGMKL